MKKFAQAILSLMVVLGLVACSGGNGNTQEAETTTVAETSEFSFPLETQLMLGTLKLDGTDLEVTTDQASELLTLWKAFKSLSTSDTTAQEEIDAVIRQIQDSMTTEQLDAIQAMDLQQGDMSSIMEDLGIIPEGAFLGGQGGGAEGTGLPEGEIIINGTPGPGGQGFTPPEGGFTGGGGPGGGFRGGEGADGQGFGQNLDPEQLATLQAERGDRSNFRNRASLFLIDPLIQYLEGKVS